MSAVDACEGSAYEKIVQNGPKKVFFSNFFSNSRYKNWNFYK